MMTNQYIGIDLGGTNIKAGAVDSEGQVRGKVSIPTEADRGPDGVIERMCQAAQQAMDQAGWDRRTVRAIGIGAPGSLNHSAGVIVKPPNLPGWENVPVRDRLAKHFGLPATLENDANAAAWGESWVGAGKGAHSLVLFTIGTGIGGGIVWGGRFMRGFFDNAAEIGHMIVEPGGRVCGCGQRGCFEAHASASNTARVAIEAIESGRSSSMKPIIEGGGELTTKVILEHMLKGDVLAREVWHEACRYLAIGAINVSHIINSELIVLSGGMTYAGEHLLGVVRKYYKKLRSPAFGEGYPQIVLAELGNDAGFIGAAGAAKLADEEEGFSS